MFRPALKMHRCMSRCLLQNSQLTDDFLRYYNERKRHDSRKDQTSFDDIAYETKYFYKQDKKLLQDVKQRTQDEVTSMRNEIQVMLNKIEEYNRNINENLRFLKDLERDLSANNDKKN